MMQTTKVSSQHKGLAKTRSSARISAAIVLGLGVLSASAAQADTVLGQGRFLATGGIQSLDGAAGGGINPWAVIADYGTNDQINPTASFTNVTLPDFSVNQLGVSVGIYNRLELSFAYQTGTLGSNVYGPGGTVALPLDGVKIGQKVLGAKVRLFGDAVYNSDNFIPQVALGVEYKMADNTSGSLVVDLE